MSGLFKRSLMLGVSGCSVLLSAWLYLHPAWSSEESIRAALLKETPLGSSMIDVRAFGEKNQWLKPGAAPGHSIYWISGPSTTGADGSIMLCGRRHDPFPYRTEVGTAWLFDSSNRLVAITVIRHE